MNNVVIYQKIIISTIGLAVAGNLTLIFPTQAATITGTGNATFEFDEDVNNSSEYGWTINFQPEGGSGAAGSGGKNNFVVIAANSTKQWTLSIWNKNGSEDQSNWTRDDTPEYKKCYPKHESNSLINYFASIPYSIFGFFLGEPALAQGEIVFKGALSGDISCSSSCVPEPITGVILGGLAAGGWMVKRKKQKSV